jgi:alpha,alpha-trehalase
MTDWEGIHLGAMAGTVDLVQRGQTGLQIRHDLLHLDPCLPEELQVLRLRIRYRGHWLERDVDAERMRVRTPDGWTGPTKLVVRDTVHEFRPGIVLELPCRARPT